MSVVEDLSCLRRLLRLVRPHAPVVAAATILRILSQGGSLLVGGGAAVFVGSLIGGASLESLAPLGWVLAGVGLIKGLARYGEQVLGHGVAFRLLAEMRSTAYRALERRAPAFPGEDQSGEVVSRLTADVDRIEVFYAHTIGPVAAFAVLGPAAAVVAGVLGSWWAGTAVALGLLLIGAVYPASAYFAGRKAGGEARSLGARTLAQVQENLRGAEQIHLLGAGEIRRTELAETDTRRLTLEDRLGRIAAVKDGLIEVTALVLLGTLVLLGLGGWPLPVTAGLVAWSAAALVPALGVGRAFDDLPETLASSRRYFDLIDGRPAVIFGGSGWGGPPTAAGVSFQSVTFGYGDRTVIEDRSLEVPEGRHLVLAGPSGSGKSTLLRLAARFYDPDQGTVALAGNDLRQGTEEELRLTVSYLGQDAYVFSGSLGDNLRLTSPLSGAAQLEAVLDKAGLFAGDSDRLDRDVGLRGSRLSGGERRRLALARLLLQDTPVVVLDEAFSSLDSRGRQALRDELLATLSGKTILESSHEVADQDRADLVIKVL